MTSPEEATEGTMQWWAGLLAGRAREETSSIDNFFQTLASVRTDEETRSSIHTHWILSDPQGRPRVNQLARRLADEVVDYCIPRSRIDEAVEHHATTGSTRKILALHREAVGLFSRLEKSGEGGELLLYFLLEVGLGIPQILCKMALKTNSQMHVHGVDGVHASMSEDGTLAVYWGESKVYDDFNSAAKACFKSIEPYLNDDGTGPSQRDILLVRGNLDAGSAALSLKLAQYFTEDAPEASKLEVRGACLISFSFAEGAYGSPFEADGLTVAKNIVAHMDEWHGVIRKRMVDEAIDTFEIEVFCVPLPSAAKFRSAMRNALGLA